VARRFTRLLTRRVLLAQDRLAELEARLDQLDADDLLRINLASRRHDQNEERTALMREAEAAIRDYESAVASYRSMAALPSPNDFDVESMGNWLYNNKPLIREEADFINHPDDLAALDPRPAVGTLDHCVHKLLRTSHLGHLGDALLASKTRRLESRDDAVHLRSPKSVELVVRAASTTAVIFVLGIPILVINSLQSGGGRLAMMLLSVIAVAAFLELLARPRPVEVFIGTATYAAILVVFVVPLH